MPEIDKKGVLDGKREIVNRSNFYWFYMNKIQSVINANHFIHFWIDRAKELQGLLRKKAPDVVGDLFRNKIGEFTITFSYSDDAINQLQPVVREFSSSGAAVKILGYYELYFLEIIRNTIKIYPEKVDEFSKIHKTGNPTSHEGEKKIMQKKLSRGLTFVEDIFVHSFHPSYSPCMNFFFQLRNVAVHNANIADDELCRLAESEFIKTEKQIKSGKNVEWSVYSFLTLNQLVTQILDEVDVLVSAPLKLEIISRKPHWYYSERKYDK